MRRNRTYFNTFLSKLELFLFSEPCLSVLSPVLVWVNLCLPVYNQSHYGFAVFWKLSEKRPSTQSTYDIFIETALRIYFPCDFYWSRQLLCDLFVRSGVSWCYWSSRFLCEELHWLVSWQALTATCKAVTGDICHHKSGARAYNVPLKGGWIEDGWMCTTCSVLGKHPVIHLVAAFPWERRLISLQWTLFPALSICTRKSHSNTEGSFGTALFENVIVEPLSSATVPNPSKQDSKSGWHIINMHCHEKFSVNKRGVWTMGPSALRQKNTTAQELWTHGSSHFFTMKIN